MKKGCSVLVANHSKKELKRVAGWAFHLSKRLMRYLQLRSSLQQQLPRHSHLPQKFLLQVLTLLGLQIKIQNTIKSNQISIAEICLQIKSVTQPRPPIHWSNGILEHRPHRTIAHFMNHEGFYINSRTHTQNYLHVRNCR